MLLLSFEVLAEKLKTVTKGIHLFIAFTILSLIFCGKSSPCSNKSDLRLAPKS